MKFTITILTVLPLAFAAPIARSDTGKSDGETIITIVAYTNDLIERGAEGTKAIGSPPGYGADLIKKAETREAEVGYEKPYHATLGFPADYKLDLIDVE